MKSFLLGFILTLSVLMVIFFYSKDFYENTSSIFLVNSNYNTYLFDDGDMILPTKYQYETLENIPNDLLYLLLWSEDRDFYKHNGINPKTMIRAMVINLQNFDISQGGSTLTQQLAKTLYLTYERTMKRKILDVMLAFFIEKSYTKDEILEAYVNSVYLGNDISGFGAAARRYFEKDLTELTIYEKALLVGIINSPEYSNPYKYPQDAKKEARILLDSLNEENPVFEKNSDFNKDIEGIDIYPLNYNEKYLDMIYSVKEKEEELNLKGGGYTIKTTFNRDLFNSISPNSSQTAIVINNKTGKIKSFWGGEYSVYQSEKQIGSSVKPFYYSLALNKGFNLNTVLPDKKMSFSGWEPENYDKQYRGEVELSQALINSINIPSIYLASHIENSPTKSVDKIKDFLQNEIKMQADYPNDLTIALGTLETNPYNMVRAINIFPNYGIIPELYSIEEIYDRKGNLIYKNYPDVQNRIQNISIDTYSAMNQLLRKVVTEGSAQRANIDGLDLHGKTGSPELSAWFTGYTGNKSISVRIDGEDLLSSTSSVPFARLIAENFIYTGYNVEVPTYVNTSNIEQKADFFSEPIIFLSKGYDFEDYLERKKFQEDSEVLKEKIENVIDDLEYIYPDISKQLKDWISLNLVDFLDAPYSFIQNNYNLENYLENLVLNPETVNKLKELANELSYVYPYESQKIKEFLREKGY
ncbi:MAG: transglycosylase domain-containing protein [Thermotogota bacterium]